MPASRAAKGRAVQVANRRAAAARMLVDGYSYQEIADTLGYASRGDATKDMTRALEQAVVEQRAAVEVLRRLEIDRLDKWQLALLQRIEAGEPRAIEVALKLSERRAKLLGLDVAQQIEVRSLDSIDAEIRDLVARLGRGEPTRGGEAGTSTDPAPAPGGTPAAGS